MRMGKDPGAEERFGLYTYVRTARFARVPASMSFMGRKTPSVPVYFTEITSV